MIQPGQSIPQATVYEMVDGQPKTHTSKDLWGHGSTIIFGLPGAFTPVCSAQHVPGFITQQHTLHDLGIKEVFCLAVNDVFVLEAWRKTLQAPSFVRFISDGNGELTRRLGLEFDGSGVGLGLRCQRFVLRIKDGIVLYCGVEETAGQCTLTHADQVISMLKHVSA